MRTTLPVALILTLACCVYASGQTPTPRPTPPPADEADVVKITTALVQVDVTVTDKKGNIVTDLKPEEIEIYENGEKQPITRFSFVSSSSATAERRSQTKAEKPGAVLPPPTPVRPDQVKRTVALLVDDLTLSFESTYH